MQDAHTYDVVWSGGLEHDAARAAQRPPPPRAEPIRLRPGDVGALVAYLRRAGAPRTMKQIGVDLNWTVWEGYRTAKWMERHSQLVIWRRARRVGNLYYLPPAQKEG